DRCRSRSARNITVPLSSETTTRSRPVKSCSIFRASSRTRPFNCDSVMSARAISSGQLVGFLISVFVEDLLLPEQFAHLVRFFHVPTISRVGRGSKPESRSAVRSRLLVELKQ